MTEITSDQYSIQPDLIDMAESQVKEELLQAIQAVEAIEKTRSAFSANLNEAQQDNRTSTPGMINLLNRLREKEEDIANLQEILAQFDDREAESAARTLRMAEQDIQAHRHIAA